MNSVAIGRSIRALAFSVSKYCFYLMVVTFSLFVYILPQKFCFGFMKITEKFFRKLARITLGINTQIRGTENLPDKPCILAMKHQSAYDILFPFRIFDQPTLIMKKELLYVPFANCLMMRMKMIAVDRTGGTKSLRKMLNATRKQTDAGRSVLIFPEGTRKTVGAKPDYKPGVALLYRKLDLPCVPVAVNSGTYWMGQNSPTPPGGQIIFDIQKPIPPGLDKKTFMNTLQNSIETACNKLDQQQNQLSTVEEQKI